MKYIMIEFLLFFIFGLFLLEQLSSDKVLPTFNEDVNNLDFKLVTVKTPGLTTKNFFSYFKDTSLIVSLNPAFNNLYKERIGNISFSCQRNCAIKDLDNYCKSILEKNYFIHDSALVDYYGVSIESIVVHVNNEQLNNLLKKCIICKTK